MKRKVIAAIIIALMCITDAMAQRLMQPLGRSVVAVSNATSQNVMVTWRKLVEDGDSCLYNLYVKKSGGDYQKVNSEPIAKTNMQTTKTVVPYGSQLAVTTVIKGKEGEKSEPFTFKQLAYKDAYFDFDFDNSVIVSNNYRTKYAWPMDIDGNGTFDAMLVDRLYCGGAGNDPTVGGQAPTTNHKLQAYRFDGTLMWTIDIGPNINICAGQNDMVVAYDINCDGKCEVIIKSSDGTRFWDKANNTWGKYAMGSSKADVDGDGIVDYRTSSTKNPPFYVSVVDAATGAEIDCSELKYDEVTDGVDKYSRTNRSDYMNDDDGREYAFLGGHFAICYFDGVHPSLAMECYNRRTDKGHHYYVFAWGYDWSGNTPSNWHHYYTWSRNDKTPWPAEFHQLRVADVDGDGIDEMLEGGYAVNPTKGMVMSAGIGHGDRYDVTDIDPERPGMEVFAIQQTALLGQLIYDAATGEHIREWYLPTVVDVGRGRCIDVNDNHKGLEVFSTMQGLYDCKGNLIADGDTPFPYEATWWDGDLQRELISSPGGSNYGTNVMVTKYNGTRLIEFSKQSNWTVSAGPAVRPTFMGDITGDWREEIILAKQNNDSSTGLVGYTTDIATDYSIYCLQQDPHYRLDCTTRGYYQAPCTSFYLGGDMPQPPLPPVMSADETYHSGTISFANGKSIMFDISGDNSSEISFSGEKTPAQIIFANPKGHDYKIKGGSINSSAGMVKTLQGKVTINGDMAFKQPVVISEGSMEINGKLTADVDIRSRGTLAGNTTVKGNVSFEGALNYEGCRLIPGNDSTLYGVMTFDGELTIPGNVYIVVNAVSSQCSSIKVNGNLTFTGDNTIIVNKKETKLMPGRYVIAECTGTLTATPANMLTLGLNGINYDITIEDNKMVLTVNATRAPQKNVAWTGAESAVWDDKADNFTIGNNPTYFVSGDEVLFGDDSTVRTITVNDLMQTNNVTFDFDNGIYTLNGEGGLSGNGDLIKNGKGELKLNLNNSDYTGATILNEGKLTIKNILDGGNASPLGASSAAEGNLQLNGGTLAVDGSNVATDHNITVADTTPISVVKSNMSLSLKGQIKGSGYIIKDGAGQLNFNYAGTNPFTGMIVRNGTVAQGEWNSTFGKVGGPMELAGGKVRLLDVNNSSTRPVFNHDVTVKEGTSSTIIGTTRGAVNGKFKGTGTLTIESNGVRSDIGADFSAFAGTLNVAGSNFRLMDNVTDMKQTSVKMQAGSVMSHYQSNSGTQTAITTHIGSLASTASDCTLGHSLDSYYVGYDGKSTSYAGLLKAKTIVKTGEGTLTIKTGGSTSSINVKGGALIINNNPISTAFDAITTGSITIDNGAMLMGRGCGNALIVKNGGTVVPYSETLVGKLRMAGNVTLQTGSRLVIKAKVSDTGINTNDMLRVNGTLTHGNDTIEIRILGDRILEVGEELTIIETGGQHKGTYTIKTVSANQQLEWDDSRLLTEGVLVVKSAVTTAIDGPVNDDNSNGDAYTLDGVKVPMPKHGNSHRRPYIINGKKVLY